MSVAAEIKREPDVVNIQKSNKIKAKAKKICN